MGVATMRAPNGLRPPNPTKKLADRVDHLGQPLSRNHFFDIFRDEPTPLVHQIDKIRYCTEQKSKVNLSSYLNCKCSKEKGLLKEFVVFYRL